jgi:hypothetical protein
MGNEIGSGRREPSLLPVPITELPTLRWLRANQNKRFLCRLLYMYKKKFKKKFYVVTYIWPILFSSIAF